jgi:hypothetical protein
MNRLTLIFSLLFMAGHFLPAQSLTPEKLRSPEDHVVFFDTISQMHQELVRRSGPVIREYGWESAEHLALRDSTLKRNAYLRDVVDRYLNSYGFPTPSQDLLARRKAAQAELVKAMGEEMKRRMTEDFRQDSIARDSIVLLLGQSYGKDITLRNTWPTVMLILDTEPDFSKRCENITWLRFEWEEGNLSTQSMLAYLRHTYAAQHGKELDIATGSTERERIFMHARELSGCWGS